MQKKTELAIRSIANVDQEIDPLNLERAIGFLYGRPIFDHDVVRIIRYKDACAILGISYKHFQYLLDRGYLTRVFGVGKQAIGVTQESITRFTRLRTQKFENKEASK